MRVLSRLPLRWLVLMLALALLAAGCAGEEELEQAEQEGATTGGDTDTAAEPQGEPTLGGTVVYGADQEMLILNPFLSDGSSLATSNAIIPVLSQLYTITPEFEYVPQLLAEEAEVTEDPFTVTYTLREEAIWNDGTPITAQDVAFTYETIMNEEWDITSRDGYDQISGYEILDDKTIRFDFSQPYAPWQTLFTTASGSILPAHILEGEDFNTFMNDGFDFASGPFQFEEWNRGSDLTIVRNESYWGEPANLDAIVYRFIEDSNTQVQALRSGEIDIFYPQPQVDLVQQVEAIEGVNTDVSAGTTWEHLDFQFGNPLLSQQYVRQAIAYGIDRAAIVEQFIVPMQEDAVPLQNVIYVNNQEQYEPHFDRYSYDPEQARALLEDNGCTQGGDGIYECNGERLSFTYKTTSGNQLRELTQQVIQQQLAEVGIEVVPENYEPSVLFSGEHLIGCNYELIMFGWVGSPDPASGNTIWTIPGIPAECPLGEGAGQNYMQYQSQEVTDLIQRTDTLLDPQERAEAYNQADAIMAEDVPVLPLYQKPTFLAWQDNIVGPADNPTQIGPLWNAAEWALTEEG